MFGVLFVPPIFLFFPTTFAYFASYLVLHAAALLVRAMVVFLVSSLESIKIYFEDGFSDENDGIVVLLRAVTVLGETQKLVKLVQQQQSRGKKFLRKYCKHVVQFWWGFERFDFKNNNYGFMGSCVNALRCFGRLPAGGVVETFF